MPEPALLEGCTNFTKVYDCPVVLLKFALDMYVELWVRVASMTLSFTFLFFVDAS